MVLNNTLKANIKNDSLDRFDSIAYFGVSTDLNAESPSSDTLTGEILRKILSSKVKDSNAFTYDFDGVLTLLEANDDLAKVGFFITETGDDLQLSKVFPVVIEKDNTKELNIGYQIQIELIDET